MKWTSLLFLLTLAAGAAHAQQTEPTPPNAPAEDLGNTLRATVGGKSGSLEVASGGPRLRFLDVATGLAPVDGVLHFAGGPFIVEAQFDAPQDRQTIAISIEWESGQDTLEARVSEENPLIYRSEQFFISRASEGDGAAAVEP